MSRLKWVPRVGIGAWTEQQGDVFSKHLILWAKRLITRSGLGIARSHPVPEAPAEALYNLEAYQYNEEPDGVIHYCSCLFYDRIFPL